MSKDLHNMDDIFNSAYREFGEDPSPEIWEKINARLDKKDAESYKKRFIGWKRLALLLLLLLAGFILYESGFLKKGSGHSGEKTFIQKPVTPVATEGSKETINQNHEVIVNKNHEGPGSVNNGNKPAGTPDQDENLLKKGSQKDIIDDRTEPSGIKKSLPWNKVVRQKNMPVNRQAESVTGKNKEEVAVVAVTANNTMNEILRDYLRLSKEKMSLAPGRENKNPGEIVGRLLTGIRQDKLPSINDPILVNNNNKNGKQKNITHFRHFWAITGFVSYDRASYRLDSDFPNSITAIRHREVHEPSYSGGFLTNWQLKKHWAIQTGLIYSFTAIGISPQKLYALQGPAGNIAYKYITSSGYAYIKPGFGAPPAIGDSLAVAEAKHTVQHISVPAVIKHTIANKKFSFTAGAGIEANLLTSARIETEIQDASNREIVTIHKLSGTRPFYWSLVAEAELRYNLNKKLSLNLRPAFRSAISPITRNNVVETFPYSFGLGIGITSRF